MNDEEDEARLVGVVWEGLAGPRSIPLKLRVGQGLDRAQLQEVTEALDQLVERYEGRDVIPKRLAAAFLDLHQAMEQGLAMYPQEEQDAIEDAASEIATMAAAILCEDDLPAPDEQGG